MSDISLSWNPQFGIAEISVSNGTITLGHDLETAILISLHTDRVADPGDVLPGGSNTDPRGWWADTFEGDQIGSKLWQVWSRVRNQDTLNFARDTATQALQWMIDDGVAQSVTVTPSFYGSGGLALNIVVTEPSGEATEYTYAWSQES